MLKYGTAACLASLALGMLAGSTQLGNHAMAQRPGFADFPDDLGLARNGMQRRWYTQVPTLKGREEITSLTVSRGLLLATTSGGMLHCVDDETGRLIWTSEADAKYGVVFPPAVTRQFVYVTSGSQLTQYDKKNGRILWTKVLPSAATAGIAANEEFIYVPTSDHRLQAIGLTDDFMRTKSKHPIAWFYYCGAKIDNAPIVLEDRVVATCSDGKVYALTLDRRDLFYRYFTGSTLAAPLSAIDRDMYVAAVDSSIYAVDLVTGLTRWRFITGYPISQAAVPFLSDVLVVSDGAGLFSIDNKSGRDRWLNDRVVRIAGVSEAHVYGFDRNHNLLQLDRQDGHAVASIPLPSFTVTTVNQYNDRIYLASKSGLLLCLAEKANQKPYLHPQKFAKEDLEERKKGDVQPMAPTKKKGFFDDVLEKKSASNVDKVSKKKSKDDDAPEEKSSKDEKKGKAKSFFDD